MSVKTVVSIIVAIFIVFGIVGAFTGMIGINNGQNWVYLQHLGGQVVIVDEPGVYWKWFGRDWVYPRYIEFRYNDDPSDGEKEIESIGVTYNDGGTAQVSTYIRLATPATKDERIAFHQQFGGLMDNIKASTKSYMIDCLKSTAPLMSSSENQSARKAEFKQVVEGQLKDGTYKMRKETVKLKDETDITGQEITIFKTEIVTDADGMPIIVGPSPIATDFGMTVVQFSVTGTAYDTETRKQFAAKKASFLLTEQAKADREKETQNRLMIIERGLREKAEAEATANVEKAKAVIAAEQKAEVALQTKIEAETKAEQLLSVAEITKKEKLTLASMGLEVAEIKAQEADAQKRAKILEAEGMKQAIELSGAITEIEQAMIDAEVAKAEAVANALAKIKVPSTMFIGGGAGQAGSGGLMENLINMKLMVDTGILDKTDVNASEVAREIDRTKADK